MAKKIKLVIGQNQWDAIIEAVELARASYEGVPDDAEWVSQEKKFSKLDEQLMAQFHKQAS